MKNKIIISLILLLIGAFLFADPTFVDSKEAFRPVSARFEAMGGAGLATSNGLDAFFVNPANLGDKKFSLNLPSVTATIYNPKKIIDSGIIDGLTKGNPESYIIDFISSLGTTLEKVANTNVALSFSASGFGLGLVTDQNIFTNKSGTELLAEVNVSAVVGLGLNIKLIENILSIDIGAAVRPTYRAYTSGAKIAQIGLGASGEDESDIIDYLMGDVKLMAGSALPFDFGVNLNLPIGFRISAVARNINGNFKMQKYEEAGAWINDMLDLAGLDKIDYPSTDDTFSEQNVEVPWSLDIGFGWVGSFGKLDNFIKPSFAFDFVDVVGFAEEAGSFEGAFWNHVKTGLELRLLSTIALRAGLNRGALSLGVGLDLFAIRIDAAYYWHEKGDRIGDRRSDALTVRFNIGYDR